MRLACLALALGSLHALGAMCPPPGPTLCQEARSEVVFLGRAVEAYPRSQKHAVKIWRPRLTRKNRPAHWNDNFIPFQTTRFEVLEVYRGVYGKYVVLHTKMEPHMGYIFEQGATYLIFADRNEDNGVLNTSGCGRTQRITGDNPDLTTIRQIFAETKRGRLYGYATEDHSPFLIERPIKPVPNVTITLTSPTLALERTTAADGAYDFSFLPAGRYTLTAHLKGQAISLPRELTIEPQSCSLVPVPVTLPSPKQVAHHPRGAPPTKAKLK